LVSAEISAPRGLKTTFVEKFFKCFFSKLMGGYALKVSKFPLHTKKVIFDGCFGSEIRNCLKFGSPSQLQDN
jgi:hypothetical protein